MPPTRCFLLLGVERPLLTLTSTPYTPLTPPTHFFSMYISELLQYDYLFADTNETTVDSVGGAHLFSVSHVHYENMCIPYASTIQTLLLNGDERF